MKEAIETDSCDFKNGVEISALQIAKFKLEAVNYLVRHSKSKHYLIATGNLFIIAVRKEGVKYISVYVTESYIEYNYEIIKNKQ